jgi:hypothetical protein
METPGKTRQVMICPVSLDDQEPVERNRLLLRLYLASQARPCKGKRLPSPVGVVDDGVTGKDRPMRSMFIPE